MDVINYLEQPTSINIKFLDDGIEWYGNDEDKPEIERDLQKYQSDYYKENDPIKKQQIWSDMFAVVQKYAKSLVLKKITGKRWRSPEDVEDDSIQTALAFMSQYIYRPGFHVGASFAGMMNPKVVETVYKQNNDDKVWSLNSLVGDSSTEFQDIQEHINFEPIYNVYLNQPEDDFFSKIEIKELLYELLKEFDHQVKNEVSRIKLRAYLLILLRKPKNKHIIPCFLKYICNYEEKQLIELFQLELYKRLNS